MVTRGLAIPALALLAVGAAAWVAWDMPGPARATSADARTARLAPAFTAAAEAIRRAQHSEGYWATPVTFGRRYENPTTEVNVFTPAVMIDLLEPMGRETGLQAELARAKAYLRRQVEATGLVRYHGNPGPIGPAQQGCELPPDADDTALVWRIAPPSDRRLLLAARRTIERYMDGDGLYRTWLADDKAYRCFYTRYAGREWNPPDVAIEMHVYLFLAEHDRAAAGRLCAALKRRIDEDRIWVWYAVAPLLPVLREVDLHRKGCSLRVPAARVEQAVSGQEPYLAQVRLLQALLLGGVATDLASPSAETSIQALGAGAADGFARLATTPPLLYHNDLSAVPPHFHWSAEVGHALWLRLYVETARRFPRALRLPAARLG